jgi:hypothetical protein
VLQPLGDQRLALLIVPPVEDADFRRLGTQKDAGGTRGHTPGFASQKRELSIGLELANGLRRTVNLIDSRPMADHAPRLYVQIDIGTSMERLWEFTQSPELHRRWDLRFTDIQYLPRTDPNEAQRFLYATRIGFGVSIRGKGETAGSYERDGQRSSALRFWSDDAKSLIREGSGYWRYTPREGGIRFATGYDYVVRFGSVGRFFDRFIFRPLIGWATAWSFDRLRLWLERDIPPEVSMRQSVVYFLARVAVAFIWIWHGVVPKLIYRHVDELAPLIALGFSERSARVQVIGVGWVEAALGMILLIAWRARWPVWLTLAAMPVALVGVAIYTPSPPKAAFNPVTLNVSMFTLAAIALLSGRDLPSARHCRRKQEAA